MRPLPDLRPTRPRITRSTITIGSGVIVETLKFYGLIPNKLPKRSPNLNGRCKKFIGTIKNECLSKFILFGRKHLDHLVDEFTEYYYQNRSHMCRGHLPPVRGEPDEIKTLRLDEIEVKAFVGGLQAVSKHLTDRVDWLASCMPCVPEGDTHDHFPVAVAAPPAAQYDTLHDRPAPIY